MNIKSKDQKLILIIPATSIMLHFLTSSILCNQSPEEEECTSFQFIPLSPPTNNGSLTATKDPGLISAFPLKLETQNSDFGIAPN